MAGTLQSLLGSKQQGASLQQLVPVLDAAAGRLLQLQVQPEASEAANRASALPGMQQAQAQASEPDLRDPVAPADSQQVSCLPKPQAFPLVQALPWGLTLSTVLQA